MPRRAAPVLLILGLMGLAPLDEATRQRPTVSRTVLRPRPAGWTLDPAAMKAGVVLGMYSRERGYDYGPKLREIRALGAGWVELMVVHYQDGPRSDCIAPDPVRTPRPEEVARAVRQAHALGLRVLLLPVVLLDKARPEEWRGNIAPESLTEWFDSYRAMLLGYAELCEREGVEALSVGSELCSMERYFWLWRPLVEAVRARYCGLLTYSANWDHYRVAGFHDQLDFLGLSAYFSLVKKNDASLEEIVAAWTPILERLEAWQREHGKPVAFLEAGYPPIDGGVVDPWNYLLQGPMDLEEQALGYEALRRVLAQGPLPSGAFFYDWWDEGGPQDRSYTPRGKPAEAVLRKIFAELGGAADR